MKLQTEITLCLREPWWPALQTGKPRSGEMIYLGSMAEAGTGCDVKFVLTVPE